MKNLITYLVLCMLSGVALADTWIVDDDGKADFDNIQAAVDAASDGDEIVVSPGIYTGGSPVVNMSGKAVWLHSSGGQEETIIDGEVMRQGIRCNSGETSKTIIEGFTITNCYNSVIGGGMYNYNSSPTLIDCTFINNTTERNGGGMLNFNSSPSLINCKLEGNSSGEDDGSGDRGNGGGMYNYNSSPTLTNCIFKYNSANHGGGMRNADNSNPILTGCTFENNASESISGVTAGTGAGMDNRDNCNPTLDNCTFTNNFSGTPDWTPGYGGGMYNRDHSSPALANCIFTGNTAHNGGGGIYNYESSPTLENCTFTNNTANDGWGGGMHYNRFCSPTLTNCTFTDNTAKEGGGMSMYTWCNPTLDNCIFTNNIATHNDDEHGGGGGGMMMGTYSSPTLTNCTFTNNSAVNSEFGGGGIYCDYDCSPVLTDCTFTANTAYDGGGIYNFVRSNPTLTDCTFTDNTATNSGGGMYTYKNYSSPILTESRFCGNTPNHIEGPLTDLGWNLYWDTCNDCNGNSVDDLQDILNATSLDCDNDLTPDECQHDCDGDGVPDPTELYCLNTHTDYDNNGHPDDCQEDCDDDGYPDSWSIELGIVTDCNMNGIPDLCDIADGTTPDCNENGLPDLCDLGSPGLRQDVHLASENWHAGTSVFDPYNYDFWNRAEHVMLSSVEAVTVWGVQQFYDDDDGWIACDNSPLTFNIRSYTDNAGLPGNVVTESLNTPATRTSTGHFYQASGGMLELMMWEMDFAATNVEHLSIQSVSQGEDCSFLWMSSGTGDSLSAVAGDDIDSDWSSADYDLSIFVEIVQGTSNDINGDGIPDECQCLADINNDGQVDVSDLLFVISQWNLPGGLADVDYDGIVRVSDLLIVIAAWGPCE